MSVATSVFGTFLYLEISDLGGMGAYNVIRFCIQNYFYISWNKRSMGHAIL